MDARKETPDAMEGGQDKSTRCKRSSSEGKNDKKKLLPERTKISRSQSEGDPKSISSFAADLEMKERISRKNSRRKSFRFFSVSPSTPMKATEQNEINSTKYTALK